MLRTRRSKQRETNAFTSSPQLLHTKTLLDDLSYVDAHRQWQRHMAEKIDNLREVEDRREYHPLETQRAPRTVHHRDARRLVAVPSLHFSPFNKFNVPEQVIRCIRRKIRREVMHALKLRGKGSGKRHRKRDEWSDVHCR